MHPEIDKLITMALSDGQITDKEREIILRKAEKLDLDVDEVEMYLEGFISSNKSNINPELNQEIPENRKIKTPKKDLYSARKFNPKTVLHIEPALLDKEKDLKLKIEEVNNHKTKLFDELENLYTNIKTPQDYLVGQKIIVDNQLITIKAEFDKTSKNYLYKFINEINVSVSEKFGNTALILNNTEKLIELDSNKIVTVIKNQGKWDISSLSNKYGKKSLLFKVLSWVSFIATLIIGNQKYNNLQKLGIERDWGISISIFVGILAWTISSNYSKLTKKNKMNFNDEDLNPILNRIVSKYKNELEELVMIKNHISELEILQKKLELKNITEFKR